VHLPGKSHASNVIRAKSSAFDRFRNGDATGPPPILRTLLSPSDLRRGKRFMLLSRRSDHVTLLVKDQSPRTAGSNVNAEIKNGRPLSSLNVEYKRELA
jgi:hypothetical protein